MSQNATRTLRRIVLTGALLAALGMSVVLEPATVRAQSPTTAGSTASPAAPATTPPGNAADSKAVGAASRAGSADAQPPSADARAVDAAGKDTADSDRTVVVIEKDGKRVQVTRPKKGGKDRGDLDTFPFRGPPTGMIVAIVAIVFLSPALIVGLFIWYRLRKARMLNETMLKLAERGAVGPAEAIQALSSGQPPPGLAAAAAMGTAARPLADHVGQIQHRAATADLRKAVILGAVGLGFVLYSLFDDGSANFVGLVLTFLGAGYGLLWWFETRHAERIAQGPGSTPSQP